MNILIVDDEPIIRIGLKTLIDWDKYGLNLFSEASNGIEAFDIIQGGQVDILITDIRMPVMDGLELIRRTNHFTKDIKILVLSCLDDFSYVKEAMKLGARDYILKPTMEPDELLTVIQQLCETLQEERAARQQLILWQNEMEQSRQFQLAERIRNFMRYGDPDANLAEELFSKANGLYSLMVFYAPSIAFSPDQYEFKGCAAVIKWQKNALFLLFSCELGLSELEQHNKSYYKAQEMVKQMRIASGDYEAEWLIGIGPAMCNLEELKQRIAFHYWQLQRQFYALAKETIVWHKAVETADETTLPYEERNDLLRAISNSNAEGIFYQAECITRAFISIKPNVTKLQAFVFEMLGLAVGYAREQGYTNLEPYEQQYVSFEKIQAFIHVNDLNQWLIDALRELWGCRWGSGLSTVSVNPFINKALKYMKNNYNRNIGTSDIADDVKLSRSYLSDLYSKEMKESLTETLTHIRIDEAKKKLRSGEKKVYEVALEVGFIDSKTFTKTFKRIVGCTPKEYELQNK